MGINEYTCHDEKENSQSRCTPCCELVAGVDEAVLLALNPGGLLHFVRNLSMHKTRWRKYIVLRPLSKSFHPTFLPAALLGL